MEPTKELRRQLDALGIEHVDGTYHIGDEDKATSWRAAGLPFCYLNFSRLIDSLMGSTSRNLARCMEFAREHPCVLMLDEIDTIGSARTSAGDGPGKELARTTVTLMQELDRLPASVTLVAATNRLDILDPALVRRFSQVAEIRRPQDADDVMGVAEALLESVGLGCDWDAFWWWAGSHEGPWPTQAEVTDAVIAGIAAWVDADKSPEDYVPVDWESLQ